MLTRVNAAGEWHCSRCKDFLPRDDFGTDKRTGKPIAMCRECRRTHERKPPKVKPTGRYDPVTGLWRCARCEHPKLRTDFWIDARSGNPCSWCKVCKRLDTQRRQSERPRLYTPARRANKLAWDEAHRVHKRAYNAAYRRTPMGRLVDARKGATARLNLAKTEAASERNRAAIATCDAMIARLKRRAEIEEPERRRA